MPTEKLTGYFICKIHPLLFFFIKNAYLKSPANFNKKLSAFHLIKEIFHLSTQLFFFQILFKISIYLIIFSVVDLRKNNK